MAYRDPFLVQVLFRLHDYEKVAVNFWSDLGARKEHSPSYATEKQRGYEQKGQDLVCKNAEGIALY